MSDTTACPCHSGQNYADCCAPYHKGRLPKTATALMRSRYAAYSLKLLYYVIATTHPKNEHYSKNKSVWKKSILDFANATEFVSLQIIDAEDINTQATVTFRAGLMQGLKDASFTEKSTFEKINGKWLYLSGKVGDGDKFQL